MGIKGVYAEIGQGKRTSLSKLAIESIEIKGRPLRIAVDVSIWQFQNQAGKGGSNPALRTLYYRLLRLLSKSIQPLFVFDGPNKPPIKRNKPTGIGGPSLTDSNTKELLGLFGFPFHIAPGEAEAECALLQREAIVDAVLSEDVDTLMFGCGRTFRNWSSQKPKGKDPTHVSVYDAKDIQEQKPGLDREGMILIALMSGGDYNTAGIPQCGIKVACEAARAGFGKSLCRISRFDNASMEKWRTELAHELCTNEKRYFRVKHKSLEIPDSFPDKEVLGYYTHPVVSSANRIASLRDCIKWDEVNIPCLRVFVASKFDWAGFPGARKLLRGLAPALLAEKLRKGQIHTTSKSGEATFDLETDVGIVKAISKRRIHFSTDKMPELRLSYYPLDIVGLDLSSEIGDHEDHGRDGLAPLDEDGDICAEESEEEDHQNIGRRSASPTKQNTGRDEPYDPIALQRAWVPEIIVKIGIPYIFEDYEGSQRNPQRPGKGKTTVKKVVIKSGMPRGALERYITIKKPKLDSQSMEMTDDLEKASPKVTHQPSEFLAPNLEQITPPQLVNSAASNIIRTTTNIYVAKEPKPAVRGKRPGLKLAAKKRSTACGNPWTTSQTSSYGSHDSPRFQVHVSKPVSTSDRTLNSPAPNSFGKSNQTRCYLDYPALSQSLRKKHSRSATPTSPASTPLEIPEPPLVTEHSLASPPISFALPTHEMNANLSYNSTSSLRVQQHLRHEHPERKLFRVENKSRAPCYQGEHILSSPEVEPDLPSLSNVHPKSSREYNQLATSDITEHMSYSASYKPVYISSSPNVAYTSPSPAKGGSELLEFPKMKPFEAAVVQKSEREKFIMLRSSLEGAWKEVSDTESKQSDAKERSRAWRVSAVEVVDMTSDQVTSGRVQ